MGNAAASVFISYSHADRELAHALATALRERGMRVWIDEGELKVGDSLIERIATAIAEIDFFLALVSEASRHSNWCRKELALAVTGELGREGVKVLPVRVDGAAMPDSLLDVYYLTVSADNVSEVAEQVAVAMPKHQEEQRERSAKRRETARPTAPRTPAGRATPPLAGADEEPIRIVGIVEEGIGRAPERRHSRKRALPHPTPVVPATVVGLGAALRRDVEPSRRGGRRCTDPASPRSQATRSSSMGRRWRSWSAITSRRSGTCSARSTRMSRNTRSGLGPNARTSRAASTTRTSAT